jgi:hypothetical protein
MNVLLLVVTGASLALTGFMSALAWKLRREERRRSDARVAVLAEALYDDDADKSQVVSRLLETQPASSWKQRALAIGVGGAAVAIAASLMAIPARSPEGSRSDATRAGSAKLQPTDGSARLQPSETAPLELIALEHERDGEALVIRGLLRNPPGAAERDGLSAVVLLLDAGGDVLATAKAALPATRLEPGATTPFVVTVTDAADVERFRLSFRKDGRVEPHVDRRTS